MISFNSGKKVAIICDKDYDEEFDEKAVYIKEEGDKPDRTLENEDVYEILDDEDFNMNRFKRYPVKDRMKLVKALKQNVEPLDEYLVNLSQ